MNVTEADVERGARAIMQANGYERFLTAPGLYNLPIWLRAKRQARAVLLAAREAGRHE